MSLCRCRATSPFSLSRCLAVYSDVSTARTGVSNSGVTLYRRYTHLHACTFWKRAHVDLPEPLPSSLSCVKKEREALSLVTLSLSDPLPPPFSAPPSSPALPSPCLSFFSLSRPPLPLFGLSVVCFPPGCLPVVIAIIGGDVGPIEKSDAMAVGVRQLERGRPQRVHEVALPRRLDQLISLPPQLLNLLLRVGNRVRGGRESRSSSSPAARAPRRRRGR